MRKVNGAHGYAIVCCITIRDAVVATIDVSCVKGGDCNVYGHILSCYEPVFVKSETHIGLSRSAVVVPAYSSLKIRLGLSILVCGIKLPLDDELEFEACDSYDIKKVVSNEQCSIQVKATWTNAHTLLHKSGYISDEDYDDQKDLYQFVFHLLCMSISKRNGSRHSLVAPRTKFRLLEVFTVFVCGEKLKGCSIYGTINVQASGHNFCIFNKNKKKFEVCSDDGSLKISSIAWRYHTFVASEFCMTFDLKDTEERVVSLGFMRYNLVNTNLSTTGFHRRLCTVIPGEHGYAAVHYMMFKDAVESALKLAVHYMMFNDAVESALKLAISHEYAEGPRVYGRVVAYYGELQDDEDLSCYELYYKLVLFEASLDNPLCLPSNSEFPIVSKQVLSVPVEYSQLVIQSKLWVKWASFPDPVPLWGVTKVTSTHTGILSGVTQKMRGNDESGRRVSVQNKKRKQCSLVVELNSMRFVTHKSKFTGTIY